MEKQSYELTQGMKRFATVHLLCCDGSESKVYFFWRLKRRIREKLRQYPGISILHFNDGLAAAFCSGKDDFPGLIRSVTLHGLDVVFPNSFYQNTILPRFRNFQSIIAVSHATAQACIQRGLSPEKITVIPNGVDHEIAAFKPDTPVRIAFEKKYGALLKDKKNLIMMGRPVLRKGFSWFLRSVLPAFPQDHQVLIIGPFRSKRPFSYYLLRLLPVSFKKQLELMFGMPSDEENLRKMLSSPQLETRLQHLGKLPFTDILQIMSASHAFIMPNIKVEGDMEGFGLVCLEANLCGLPVFAANLEGIKEAVKDQKNGRLIPSQHTESWLEALSSLQTNPSELRKSGLQARQFVLDNYGWEKMTEMYFKHFQDIGHSIVF
ncbi:MAG: glycosyltransferase family 4 protein [Saprospiraceae bacterium]